MSRAVEVYCPIEGCGEPLMALIEPLNVEDVKPAFGVYMSHMAMDHLDEIAAYVMRREMERK